MSLVHAALRKLAQDEDPEAPAPAPEEEASGVANDAAQALDIFFALLSGFLVFFMQCGFCMLSAGSVRGKNAKNIILKNLLDACFGALGWYFFGYAFAYGEDSSDAVGKDQFALHHVNSDQYHVWFFQYTFAATAATIVSGAVAERARFEAYLLYAFFLTAWVYPVVVHWVWSESGWLSTLRTDDDFFNDTGMIDFAGCGVVHMVGGLAGFAGAAIVGPRIGRYDATGKARDISGHSAPLALLGVFILWFGWYGFNPGSAGTLTGGGAVVAANCAVTTTLSAAGGCATTLAILLAKNYFATGHLVWDVIGAGNGALGGLVGITASCSVVKPWAAILIGIIAGFVYVASSNLMAHVFRVDDPLDAVAVHAFCGAWGLIAAAAFADEDLTANVYGLPGDPHGFLVGGDGKLLVAAITGIVSITAWVLGHMIPFFFVMNLLGLLRVSSAEEQEGLDVSHHGGSAYPIDQVKAEKAQATEVQLAETGPARDFAAELDALKEEIRTMKAPTKAA